MRGKKVEENKEKRNCMAVAEVVQLKYLIGSNLQIK